MQGAFVLTSVFVVAHYLFHIDDVWIQVVFDFEPSAVRFGQRDALLAGGEEVNHLVL